MGTRAILVRVHGSDISLDNDVLKSACNWGAQPCTSLSQISVEGDVSGFLFPAQYGR